MTLAFSFFVKNKIQELKVLKSISNQIQKDLDNLSQLTELESELLKLKNLQLDENIGFMYDKDAYVVENEIYSLKIKLNVFLENPEQVEIKKQELSVVQEKINKLKEEITKTITDRVKHLQNHDEKHAPQVTFTP